MKISAVVIRNKAIIFCQILRYLMKTKGKSVFGERDTDVSFGNVILDLKKTTLEADETIINIDSSFSGVVIYVPKGWLVRLKVDSFLAGCQDMRDLTETTDMTHTLYICGDLSFSGLELRD